MSKKYSIILRKFKITDSKEILNWRNDEKTIKNSLSKNRVKESNHYKWMISAIKNKTGNHYYIASINNKNIGVVIYELNKNNNFFVSINLNPNFRGKGMGKKLLLLSQKKREIKEKNNLLYARIKMNNSQSIKVFSASNFTLLRNCKNYFLYYSKVNCDK